MTDRELQDVLQQIVERIVRRFGPERIVLFGSCARGMAGPDSDVDLLVVMNVVGSKRQAATEIDLLMQGIPIPTDILVVTPDDVERGRNLPGTVIREAMREGRMLYERAA